jgi:TRAP-type transport system periplasmic protein
VVGAAVRARNVEAESLAVRSSLAMRSDAADTIDAPVRRLRKRREIIAAAVALAAPAIVPAPARAAEFEFKCASSQPISHPITVRLTQMWKAIESESGGRIRTQFFPNSQLGGDAAMLAQTRLGAVNFMAIFWGNLAPVVPAADIGALGFAYRDVDEAVRVMEGPLGEYVRSETLAKGLFPLHGCWDAGMYQIGSNGREIRKPDDLRGFKVRTPEGRITVDLFKLLGASPTPLSLSELYTGLQSKVVEGEALGLATIETGRYYEVNKSISLTNHAWAGVWIVANNETWNRLPPDLRSLVERNNKKYAQLEVRDSKVFASSLVDKLGRRDVKMLPIDQAPFRAPLKPYYTELADAFGTRAWGLLESSLGRKLT